MEVQSLKEHLSEKELKVYELELYVTELNAQIKDLSDAKDKLTIANRNARTLEEENTNLIVRLKTFEHGKIDPSFFPAGAEAAKIIKENNELRDALRDLNATINKSKDTSKAKESDLEKQLRGAVEDRDRMSKERERQMKELDNARRQCVDLQRTLDEERDTTRAANDIWDQERERYNQKIDELLSAAKRAEGVYAARDTRPRERGNDLQELLLKEEVEQLTKKLKISEERLWNKEKEWVRTEAALKQEIAKACQGARDSSNDREVYRSLQDQIAALRREILQLRGERRSSRPAPYMPVDSDVSGLSNGTPSNGGAGGPGSRAGGPGGSISGGAAGLNGELTPSQVNTLSTDNTNLRNQIDDLRTDLLETRLSMEEKNVRIKELEVQLAGVTAKNNTMSSGSQSGGASARGSAGAGISCIDDNISERSYLNRARNPEKEIAELRQKVRTLQSELNNVRASQEQKNTINDARLKECQGQIVELLEENEKLHNGGAGLAGDASTDPNFPDHFMSVIRLSKDKRDSVEDVMRLLESSWGNETEAMRQTRNAKMQGAAMAHHDAMKDDEIRRLQGTIDDLRNAADGDRDANEDLRDRIRDLEDEIAGLKKKARDDGKQKEKNRGDLARENDALRDKIRALEDKDRAAAGDHQRQMRDLRDENNKLRRQTARSPRRDWSASHRTPERALSQLSVRSSDEQKRSAIPEGAHLAVSVVELSDVLRNGSPITEPGYIIIKLKSIKEKYKTSVKELSSVVRFDESFEFYLAQPDQDVITLHVFYKPKDTNREYHIGDACFSMATLYRGVPRQRIAPVAQNPGAKDARRAAQIEVTLQTDDFGKMVRPTDAEVEDETLRFNEMVNQYEASAPERLHAVDVYMASRELM